MTDRPIFDAAREIKGKGLTEADVALMKRAIAAYDSARTAPPSPGGMGTAADAVAPATPAPAQPSGALEPSPAAFAIIREFEGYEKKLPDGGCKAYPDPASGGEPWTIGFGSTGPDVRPGTVWTRQQAEERLERDVRKFARAVAAVVDDAPTTQAEFDAMTSLAYNIGISAFTKSTLLRKHKAGDKAGAAAEFGKWVNAAGKRMAGLVRRRAAEAKMYRGQA